MKNWKTTLIGVLGAVVLCIMQAVSTGTVDLKTLAIAGTVAAVGAFAADGNVESVIAANPIVQQLLPVADNVLTDVTKTNSSPILTEIHTVLKSIATNTAPTAAAAIPIPAIAAQPVIEAAAAVVQQPAPIPQPQQQTQQFQPPAAAVV